MADIELLFGAKGDPAGSSEAQIRQDLQDIVNRINSQGLGINFRLSPSTASQLQSQLQTIINNAFQNIRWPNLPNNWPNNNNNQPPNTPMNQDAIDRARNDLIGLQGQYERLVASANAFERKFGIPTQFSQTITSLGAEIQNLRNNVETGTMTNRDYSESFNDLRSQLTAMKSAVGGNDAIVSEMERMRDVNVSMHDAQVQLERISEMRTKIQAKLADASSAGINSQSTVNLQQILSDLGVLETELQSVASGSNTVSVSYEDMRNRMETATSSMRSSVSQLNEELKNSKSYVSQNDALVALNKIQGMRADISKTLADAGNAGITGTEVSNLQMYDSMLRQLVPDLTDVANGTAGVAVSKEHLSEVLALVRSGCISNSKVIKMLIGAQNDYGKQTEGVLSRVKNLAAKFGLHLSAFRVIHTAIRWVKKLAQESIALDSAFTQLRIVTNATDAEMKDFSNTAITLAKNLGKSVTDVTSSIETFSRLGYSLEESSTLAKYATIMSNVADTTNEKATTGLTSIIKGFNKDVEDTEHIADVLVSVGQKYAVSASEMMEAFEKSGAALAATGTSFEKSAGLVAAANAAVQNSSTVGTALKTVSARIRGSKADLDKLGEDAEDLADGFSKYAKEVKALSGVDILKPGTTNTFRDLYDIFTDLSAQWEKMTDTSRSRVSEIFGGTRQLQVISSIISNWGDATRAYETAMNSAGAATKANDIYMESAQAHIEQLKASVQELAYDLFNSDLIKGFVDFGINVITGLDKLSVFINEFGGLKTVILGVVSAFMIFNAKNVIGIFTGIGSAITRIPANLLKLKSGFTSLNAAFTAAGGGAKGFAASMSVASSSVRAATVSMLALVAVVTALYLAWTVYDKLTPSIEELADKAQEAREKHESLNEEISSLQDKLAGLETEISNIQKLGVVTLTDQEQLETLQKETAEIRAQIQLKEAERNAAKEAADAEAERLRKSFEGKSAGNTYTEGGRRISKAEYAGRTLLNNYNMSHGIFDDSILGLSASEHFDETIKKYQEVRAEMEKIEALGSAATKEQNDQWNELNNSATGYLNSLNELVPTIESMGPAGEKYLDKFTLGTASSTQQLIYLKQVMDDTFGGKSYNIADVLSKYTEGGENAISRYIDALIELEGGTKSAQQIVSELFDKMGREIANKTDYIRKNVKGTDQDIEKFLNGLDFEDLMLAYDILTSSDSEMTIDELQQKIIDTRGEAEEPIKISVVIEGLSGAQDAVKALSQAYDDMHDDGRVAFSTLEELSGFFDEEYITALAKARGSQTEINKLLGEMTIIAVKNKLGVDNLAEADENLVAAMLKEEHVANADKVAHDLVTTAKKQNEYETKILAAATADEANKILGEADAAGVSRQALAKAYLAKIDFNKTPINSKTDIDNLIAIANAAGMTEDALRRVNALRASIATQDEKQSQYKSDYDSLPTYITQDGKKVLNPAKVAAAKRLRHSYDIEESNYYELNNLLASESSYTPLKASDFYAGTTPTYTYGGTTTGSGKSGNSEKDQVLKDWEELVEQKKHLVEIDEWTQEQYYDWLAGAYKQHLTDTKKYAKEIREIEEELYDWEKEKVQKHIDDEQAVLDNQLANGLISREEYTEQMAKLYEEGYNDFKKAVEEKGLYGVDNTERLNAETEFLNKVKDAHNAAYDAERAQLDHKLAMNKITEEQYLAELERLYIKYYKDQEMYAEEALEKEEELYQKRTELVKKWAQASADAISQITEAAEKSVDAITTLMKALVEANEENFNLEKKLLEHALKMNYIDEKEYYASLEALYKKHFQDKYIYMEQYWENQEAIYEHEQQMLKDSASAIEDIHGRVVDLIKKELEEAKKAIDDTKQRYLDLIEIRRKALGDFKDEEDYEKERNEKLASISELQRQLNALSYDTSAAGVRKYKEVYDQLKKAQDELAEFERDRAYDVMERQLDNESDLLEDKYGKQTDALDKQLEDNEYLVNEAWRRMSEESDTLYQQLLEYNKKYSTSIKDDLTDAWKTAQSAMEDYYDARIAYEEITNGLIGAPGMTAEEYEHFERIVNEKQLMNYVEPAVEAAVSMTQIATGLISGFADILNSVYGTPETELASIMAGALNSAATSGTGILSSLVGLVGGFASGTSYVSKTGLYRTDEFGDELKLVKDRNGNQYRILTEGSKVIDAQSTSRMMQIAKNPGAFAEAIRNSVLMNLGSGRSAASVSALQPIALSPVFQISSSDPDGVVREIHRTLPTIADYVMNKIVGGQNNIGMRRRAQTLA